jgi:hypothetical protein
MLLNIARERPYAFVMMWMRIVRDRRSGQVDEGETP